MYLNIVVLGMRALKAPDRKKAGIRQRSTWAVRYSTRVSTPETSRVFIVTVFFTVHSFPWFSIHGQTYQSMLIYKYSLISIDGG